MRKKLKTKRNRKKIVIGWNENVQLPKMDIWDLPAKVDTGAKSSSLHVENIKRLPQKRVRFTVIVDTRNPKKNKTVAAKINRIALVRTNHKHTHNRFFIKTTLQLGTIKKEIELNLADRSDLRYRLIIGRTALANHFLVDSTKGRILSK